MVHDNSFFILKTKFSVLKKGKEGFRNNRFKTGNAVQNAQYFPIHFLIFRLFLKKKNKGWQMKTKHRQIGRPPSETQIGPKT